MILALTAVVCLCLGLVAGLRFGAFAARVHMRQEIEKLEAEFAGVQDRRVEELKRLLDLKTTKYAVRRVTGPDGRSVAIDDLEAK